MGNPVKFWQTVSDIFGHQPTQNIKEVFLDGTEILCSEEDRVEIINHFSLKSGKEWYKTRLMWSINN